VGIGTSSLEDLVIDAAFWKGRRTLVTGHTGFKGGWLCLWLGTMGAEVTGYAKPPASKPSLFEVARIGGGVESVFGDVDDLRSLERLMLRAQPEIIFHLAAQSLVRRSYADPLDTYRTNVLGTVHLLECARRYASIRSVVIVTSDKCYENREQGPGYREGDPLGGHDPYSSSKGCAEIVTTAYRRSFFAAKGAGICSVRAGNVIGGGDWSEDRLIPDLVRAFSSGQPALIRNPTAVRPWQHVLEPLRGYLLLAQKLHESREGYSEAWNFGPAETDALPVSAIADRLASRWGSRARWERDAQEQPYEAQTLRLDCSKAQARLGWRPQLPLDLALDWVADWYRACEGGKDMRRFSEAQIRAYAGLGDRSR
jgi:CDP-glucose 4,6-dehydratase